MYRVAKFDNDRFAFKGIVNDYFTKSGKQALKCNYLDGLLDGQITTYYENGNIKESGYYKQGNRDSIWCFFYENGNVEKKIIFTNNIPRLMEYYKKNGKPVFTDGNGEYEGECNTSGNLAYLRKIKGKVKNGLMVDRWKIYIYNTSCIEVYENGKFILGKGDQGHTYENFGLITLTGVPYYEVIDLIDHVILDDDNVLFLPFYDKNINLKDNFFDKLRMDLTSNQNLDLSGFFYGLFEFKIENGKIIESSFKQITNNIKIANQVKRNIISMTKWDSQEKNPSFTFYLPIIWENNKLYIEIKDYKN